MSAWLPRCISVSFAYCFQLMHSWYLTFNASIYSASFNFLLCHAFLSIMHLESTIFKAPHNKILTADVLTEIGILMPNCGYWSKFVSCLYRVKEAVQRLLPQVLSCAVLLTFCCWTTNPTIQRSRAYHGFFIGIHDLPSRTNSDFSSDFMER